MRKLTPKELVRESEIGKGSNFDKEIKEMYGNSLSFPAKRIWKMEASEEEDDVFDLPFDELAPPFLEANITDADGNAMHTTSTADTLLNAEVVLPQGEDRQFATVVQTSLDSDGKVTGKYNGIPALNTMLCDMRFADEIITPYLTNIVAENILNQVDKDGYHCQLFDGILEHSNEESAVDKRNQWVVSK